LKPTLSFHFLPKFLTEVCYYVGDYETGEAAAKLFLQREKSQLMNGWFLINSNLKSYSFAI
jgi:hypothetical protein